MRVKERLKKKEEKKSHAHLAQTRFLFCVVFFLQDVPGAVSVEEMTELLSLHKLCCGRSWHIQGCDARSGMGLHEGLDWLSRQLVAAGVLDVA